MENDILVSVGVITYNSSKYVLETLESIKAQTYQNIELIISDDCSTDNTIEICRKWLESNKERFVRAEIITVPENTGIPANCNRLIKASQGEWIKTIAGDDILCNDCIKSYIENISDKTNVLVGRMQLFYIDCKTGSKIRTSIWPYIGNIRFFQLSAKKQHRYLLTRSFNFAPAVFIRKRMFEDFGYYDESFRYFEDLPYWLNLTSKGVKFDFLDKITVLYRTMHSSMIFVDDEFYNEKFAKCMFDFREKRIYPQVPFWNFIFYESEIIGHFRYFVLMNFFFNKKTKKSMLFNEIISFLDLKRIFYYIQDKL